MSQMFDEYEKKKRQQVSQMKSLKDYGMGILILLLGLFFLFRGKLGDLSLNDQLGEPDSLEKIFGGMSVLYGLWRFYRGYKKQYFK